MKKIVLVFFSFLFVSHNVFASDFTPQSTPGGSPHTPKKIQSKPKPQHKPSPKHGGKVTAPNNKKNYDTDFFLD